MKTVFNCEEFAISRKQSYLIHHTNHDLEKNFFTPYGLLVPLFGNAIPFLRAFRDEFPLSELLKTKENTHFLHVNHLGGVWYISVDAGVDDVRYDQITDNAWVVTGFRGDERCNSIAYGYLLRGIPTLEKAVKRMDKIAADGFYNPQCFKVADVAARLKELGLTKPLIHSKLSNF